MKRLIFPLLALGLFVGVLRAIRLGSVPSDVTFATPGNSVEPVTLAPGAVVVGPQEPQAGTTKGALPEVDVRVHAGKARELFEATAQDDPMAYFYGMHYSSASCGLSRHPYLPKHNEVLVPLFSECMLHPNCRAKSTIAEELGLSGDRAVPALIRALDLGSDPGTLDRVVAALGRLGDERAVEPIIGKLDSGDTRVAWEALEKHLNDGTITYTSLGERWVEVADEYEVLWQKVKGDWPKG